MKRNKLTILIFSSILLFALAACGGGDEEIGVMSYGESEALAPMEAPAMDMAQSVTANRAFAGGGDDGFSEEADEAREGRIVIKNADLSLAVEDPEASMEAISFLAEEMGGFVVSSNLFQTRLESGVEVPQANITIRIPAELLLEILETIEGDASRVLSKNISGQDVTREYTDLQSRLRNLESTEVQLREIMASAYQTEDVLEVFYQLSQITQEIEMVTGQINYFEQAADLSAVSVTLITDEAAQPLTIGGWEPAGIAKDAIQALINTLQGLANTIIWIILYLLPTLVVIFIPLWIIFRGVKTLRNRRKNKAGETESKS